LRAPSLFDDPMNHARPSPQSRIIIRAQIS
jgi:hypothetical protein